jgi:hypothetical protein
VDVDAGLEDVARAYLAAAEGDPDRALRLALADARVVLDEASAHISFGYVRGRLPIGLAEPAPEPGAGASVAAPSATYAA